MELNTTQKILKTGYVNPADICITSDGRKAVVPEMMKEQVDGGRVSFLPIN